MDHIFVLYDRVTDSVWYPGDAPSLQAVAGASKGSSIPFLDEPSPLPLGEWLDLHPQSTILLPTEDDLKEMNRPYLGVGLEEHEGRLSVSRVADDSPASEAGFRAGDVLRRFGEHDIATRRDLRDAMRDFNSGDVVDVVVDRDGQETILHAKLAPR